MHSLTPARVPLSLPLRALPVVPVRHPTLCADHHLLAITKTAGRNDHHQDTAEQAEVVRTLRAAVCVPHSFPGHSPTFRFLTAVPSPAPRAGESGTYTPCCCMRSPRFPPPFTHIPLPPRSPKSRSPSRRRKWYVHPRAAVCVVSCFPHLYVPCRFICMRPPAESTLQHKVRLARAKERAKELNKSRVRRPEPISPWSSP